MIIRLLPHCFVVLETSAVDQTNTHWKQNRMPSYYPVFVNFWPLTYDMPAKKHCGFSQTWQVALHKVLIHWFSALKIYKYRNFHDTQYLTKLILTKFRWYRCMQGSNFWSYSIPCSGAGACCIWHQVRGKRALLMITK